MSNLPAKQERLPNKRNGSYGVGRPAKYTSPKQMQEKIDEYFEQCHNNGYERTYITKKGEERTTWQPRPTSLVGIALFLGFTDTPALLRYAREEPSFRQVIAQARARVEKDALEGGLTGQYEPKISGLHLIKHGYTKDAAERESLSRYDTLSDEQVDDRLSRYLDRLERSRSIEVESC